MSDAKTPKHFLDLSAVETTDLRAMIDATNRPSRAR